MIKANQIELQKKIKKAGGRHSSIRELCDQVGEKLGVSGITVRFWYDGRSWPTGDTLEKLLKLSESTIKLTGVEK